VTPHHHLESLDTKGEIKKARLYRVPLSANNRIRGWRNGGAALRRWSVRLGRAVRNGLCRTKKGVDQWRTRDRGRSRKGDNNAGKPSGRSKRKHQTLSTERKKESLKLPLRDATSLEGPKQGGARKAADATSPITKLPPELREKKTSSPQAPACLERGKLPKQDG